MMGDLNINIRQPSPDSEKLDKICSIFDLTNIKKSETYFSKFCTAQQLTFSTNKLNSFQKTNII